MAGPHMVAPLELERAVEAARRDRWAVVDQLLQGVELIAWSPPAEVDDTVQPCDDWAEVLVQAAAFAHVRVSPDCRGYTTWSAGRTVCGHGHCGWSMSARMGDVGTPGSAWFAHAAIARVGQTIALAVAELAQALFEAVLPC